MLQFLSVGTTSATVTTLRTDWLLFVTLRMTLIVERDHRSGSLTLTLRLLHSLQPFRDFW